MKRAPTILTFAVTSVMMSAVPILAEEGVAGQQEKAGQKNECLLATKVIVDNCPNQSDPIDDKIERLNREIAKGTAVYTPEVLRILWNELYEFQKQWDYMYNNRSSYSF